MLNVHWTTTGDEPMERWKSAVYFEAEMKASELTIFQWLNVYAMENAYGLFLVFSNIPSVGLYEFRPFV